MRSFVDFVYTLLIGAAVALFVGLGIWTFYSGPKFPEFPNNTPYYSEPTDAQKKQMETQQKRFESQMKDYQKKEKTYDKKVSAIALIAGLIFFMAGLFLMRKNDIVGEGLALGGAFSGIYAAARGATASFKPLVFVSVSLVLAMFIALALYRGRILRTINPRGKR